MNTTALDNAIDTPAQEKPERPVDVNGNAIYRVPEANLPQLQARVLKLNKRAAKLKMPPLVLTEIGEDFVEQSRREPDEETGGYHTVKYTVRVVLVTLTGTAPRINGWAMAATIQHDEAGNILRTVPGFETTLPIRYRTASRACEHCGQDRRRNDTYVLQGEVGGWKQVGRNCLADFLRSEDATGLAEYAEILADIEEFMGEFEDQPEGGGGRGYQYFSALALLTQVACVVRADGWCSRTEAKNSPYGGKEATVDTALLCMNDKWWSKQSEKTKAKYTTNETDGEKAAAAIFWAQNLPVDTTSDFLWNIRVVSHREQLSYREAGLAGSIIAAYNRHLEQETKRKYERDHPSEWVGEVGKRDVFTLTVLSTREMSSDYGPMTLLMFRDEQGNRYKWWASGTPDMDVDKTYVVKGSVKAHENWTPKSTADGQTAHTVKTTVLTRVTVYDAEAEAKAQADKKAVKKVLKKRYDCRHERSGSRYGRSWTYFHVAELDQYTNSGHYETPCCNACFEEWTKRAETEGAAK